MPNDPILHMLGLARKAGRLEIGEEPVGAVCRARQAKLVLLACDAASNTFRRAAHFGEAGNVLWLEVPFTKAELGFALGRGSCAMLALTDVGFASSLVQKLSARDPEKYGPAAQQLPVERQFIRARRQLELLIDHAQPRRRGQPGGGPAIGRNVQTVRAPHGGGLAHDPLVGIRAVVDDPAVLLGLRLKTTEIRQVYRLRPGGMQEAKPHARQSD